MTTEWQTVIRNTSNCRSVIGTLTPTVYLWAIQSLGMDGRTAYTKNCALSQPIRPVSIGGFASARCVALHCRVYLQDAQLTLRTSKFSKRFRCSNQVLTFMWMYVCPVLQKLYKNVMIYIFMIVDVLFNAYTSRYVAVGNTEIRNTQAFWETTELSTTTTSFVCAVFSRYGLGRYLWNGDWFDLICLFTSYPKHKSAIQKPQGWSALLEHTTTPPWSFWLYCRVACLPGNPAWWDASACHFISWKWWCLYLMSQEMMSVFCFFVIC